MSQTNFDEYVLASMPSFIATNYQRLLETQKPQERVELILHTYNLGLRALTINLVSQYLQRDTDYVSDPYLNALLEQKYPHPTSDAWKEILFSALRAYEGYRDRLFMPELYDFYWDTSAEPHRRRVEIELSFDRLTQATVEILKKQLVPQDESSWQTLAEELLGHLQHILHRLSFIGRYDLIRVLAQDGQFYTFELHKGIHISTERRPLPRLVLNIGCFYIRSSTEDFLLLDPWLVFGEWKPKSNGPALVSGDTGVYERLGYEHLWYLLSASDQPRESDKSIQEFIKLIYDTIANVKYKRQEAEKLSWVQLCALCENITEQRMATVQGKYHKELYLQRDKVRQHFEAFLADPKKRGFVLVGKSGVGKSNFLLAVAQELQHSRSNVCVLMYDGANLPVATSSLIEIISQDFRDRVILSRQPVEHIWHEIARIDGIDERQVIVCVDAINESPQATELLRQLDELVQSHWPWLKVVLSCRPETWQSIKRGGKLAEALYYREQGTETLGVELQPFSYSEQMEPFSRQELPEAYSKYQRTFQLQTPYEALSHEVRETLRHPLNLWLLASTYRGRAMPEHVKTSELIKQYVNARLQWEDLRFLEKRLVPLMVREGYYSNVITEADLDAAGDGLYEMVYSNQVLSDGRRMNQSFLQLSDADILLQQEQGFEQRIAFRYERFYEYFAGKRIASLSETHTDRYAFFLGLIEEATRKPFLWGAVRNALVQETKEHGPEIVQRLCHTEQQRVKEMMVSVLVMLGQDDLQQVNDLLDTLLPAYKQPSEWRKGQQLLGKAVATLDIASRNAGKIAIEVASSLSLLPTLQRAALQADATLRTEAVRYSYHLWQRNRAGGFELLEQVATCATRGLLPDVNALESVLGLSVVIFFEHYQDRSVSARLQSIWRETIATFLRIRGEGGRSGEVMRAFIRERLFSFVLSALFRILDSFPGYNFVSYQKLKEFFHLGPAEKSLYRKLVRYIDVDAEFPQEQMENDYLARIRINDLFFVIAFDLSMVPRACRDPLALLPLLRKLFDVAKSEVAAYPSLSDITKVLECVLDHDPMIDEVFDFFVETIETSQEIYTKYPHCIRTRHSIAPRAAYLGAYILHQYRRVGTVRNDGWLKTQIEEALARRDLSFFDLLLTTELPFAAIEWQKPQAALETLEMFFQRSLHAPLKKDDKSILEFIVAFLARLRIRYPDEVDDFLEEHQAPEAFRLQVQTSEPAETIGELIGERGWYFLRDEVILNSPKLRSELIQIFAKAADCKNINSWLEYFIRQIVNQIYGGEALHQLAQ